MAHRNIDHWHRSIGVLNPGTEIEKLQPNEKKTEIERGKAL